MKSSAKGILFMACVSVVTACSAAPATVPPPAEPGSVSSPSPAATPKPSAPAPTRPTAAEDRAKVKRAVLGADDLGKPWVEPKKVNTVGGKKNEDCPGQPGLATLAPPMASTTTRLTRGKQRGASIASFTVSTLPRAGEAKYRSAWAKIIQACAKVTDASHLYMVTTPGSEVTVTGTDEVLTRVDRIYYDAAHKQLAYARHYVSARTGRVVCAVEYDFLTTKADPHAKDFAPVLKLLDKQLTKTRSVFTA